MPALVDVVIAIHDERRPIERAVASVTQDQDVRDDVRVIVVCHGIDQTPIEQRLAAVPGAITVIRHDDGIRSPAGPFNAGLDAATAEYTAVMGSDDFLEPGAMSAWIAHVRTERPSAAIVRVRLQGDPVMPNPLVRVRRSNRVDPVRDRLFYRTAPLGLLRTSRIRDLGLRFAEGLPTGEDLAFGVRMWANGERVDFLASAPCYVIGRDAEARTSGARMSAEQALEAIDLLVSDAAVMGSLSPRARRALAVKLVRVHLLGALTARPNADDWRGQDEVAHAADLLRRIVGLAPSVLAPFNLGDRVILDGLLAEPSVERLTADVARPQRTTRKERWLTKNPLRSLDRESTLRRYVIYFLMRDRGSASE